MTPRRVVAVIGGKRLLAAIEGDAAKGAVLTVKTTDPPKVGAAVHVEDYGHGKVASVRGMHTEDAELSGRFVAIVLTPLARRKGRG